MKFHNVGCEAPLKEEERNDYRIVVIENVHVQAASNINLFVIALKKNIRTLKSY